MSKFFWPEFSQDQYQSQDVESDRYSARMCLAVWVALAFVGWTAVAVIVAGIKQLLAWL